MSTGVVLPEVDGARSSSAFGRTIVAAALSGTDPAGARAVERETDWRHGYPTHFRRLVEAGLDAEAAAVRIATDGLDAVHRRMRALVETTPGQWEEIPAWEAVRQEPGTHLQTTTVTGSGDPEGFTLSHQGRRLTGPAVHTQLDDWVRRGILEPDAAEAVRTVMANPEWLRLRDHRFVVLGAASEMGPLRPLLRWGADVTALDLPRPALWKDVLRTAASSGGRLHLPVSDEHADPLQAAGADLLHDTSTVAAWLAAQSGRLVVGNYVYADGAVNLRLASAVDAIGEFLRERRDLSLAWLATPTDVFAVPGEAVAASTAAYERAPVTRPLRGLARTLSGGRLLRRTYAPGSDPGLNDSIIAQQGPNYLLTKRLHRWRATVARRDGVRVSMNVAPPTRTRSVMRNRALAAAYAGAHRFGVEVFDPETSSTLMAALLVHDLHTDTALAEPWREEARQAVHGGLWRTAYEPGSALGLALLLGLGAARP